jgi:hypothetical protein
VGVVGLKACGSGLIHNLYIYIYITQMNSLEFRGVRYMPKALGGFLGGGKPGLVHFPGLFHSYWLVPLPVRGPPGGPQGVPRGGSRGGPPGGIPICPPDKGSGSILK